MHSSPLAEPPPTQCMYAICMPCTCAIKCIAFASTHTHSACKAHTKHHRALHRISATTCACTVLTITSHHFHTVLHTTRMHSRTHAHTTTSWASCRCVTTVQLAQGHSSLLSPHFALVQGGFGSCVLSLLVPKMVLSLYCLHWCFPSNYSVYASFYTHGSHTCSLH